MNSALALPLQQHPSFAAALRMLGQPVTLQDLEHAATVVTLKRCGISFASRGPIWRTPTELAEKTRQLRQSGLRLINADADDPMAYRQAGFRLIHSPASVAEMDIAGTEQDILARARSKWRNIWRRSHNSGLNFQHERFSKQKHAWLLEADLHQQQKKRFRALPHTLIEAYAVHQRKDVIAHIAYRKRDPVAAMLFLLHHPVATYHLGWASDDAKRCGAHHRLLMDAAIRLGGRGFTRLDLGQVATDTAPGLARFKIGTGAVVRPLGGTWLRIPGL